MHTTLYHTKGLRHKKIHLAILCILVCFSMLFLSACTLKKAVKPPISKSGFYFDTVITISLYGVDTSSKTERIFEECFSLCDKYEHLFSRTAKESDIWNINHSGGVPVSVAPETIELLTYALTYADSSNGKVDPTVASASSLWDFEATNPSLPAPALLEEACKHIDYHALVLDKENQTVTLTDPDAMLDLGFIAKGYIADVLKEYLLSAGIDSAILNLGGNVLCVGSKNHQPFQIGIQYPFGDNATPILTIPVSDQSVVTSGVYERYFRLEDTLYHHILSTTTGMPVDNSLLSVTILSDSSMEGDALSTTCFVLGLEDGLSLIESISNTEAVFITSDYQLHYSSGFPNS